VCSRIATPDRKEIRGVLFMTLFGWNRVVDDGEPVRRAIGPDSTDSVITPHSRQHLASAYLVVDGMALLRTFDRNRSDGNAIVVPPTQKIRAQPGHAAAMDTSKDRRYWFAPRTSCVMALKHLCSCPRSPCALLRSGLSIRASETAVGTHTP
jgi:hypothetical protein